ncbi:MAG: hypothetical protein FWE90_13170 [Defluviitaleaceae bacterium]|nr:hypothetical protein [Defluviitaleaceae bacterium]
MASNGSDSAVNTDGNVGNIPTGPVGEFLYAQVGWEGPNWGEGYIGGVGSIDLLFTGTRRMPSRGRKLKILCCTSTGKRVVKSPLP